jgi:hypothetical protein
MLSTVGILAMDNEGNVDPILLVDNVSSQVKLMCNRIETADQRKQTDITLLALAQSLVGIHKAIDFLVFLGYH